MRICIIGPGAMGRLFAVLFSSAGCEVVLLDHKPERAKMLDEKGVRLRGAKRTDIHIPVTTDPPHLPFDIILICVKAFDTERVAEQIAGWAKKSILLTLQNGMGNIEALVRYNPSSPIVAGVTACGANIPPKEPNGVFFAGCGETVIGSPTPNEEALATVVELFKKAGLPLRVTDNLQGELWTKLLVNAAINPLCALLRIRNGMLPKILPAWRLTELILAEGLTVAEAEGVELPCSDMLSKVKEVCEKTAENRCSTLQDVESNRRTEIPFINGYIYHTAKKHSIHTPYNRTLTLLLESLQPEQPTRNGEKRRF